MNRVLKIVVFVYDFPHRKSEDVVRLIHANGFKISLILAANYIKIKSPKSAVQLLRKKSSMTTRELAKKYNVPYYVVKHNSVQSQNLLKRYSINFGIIGGARILRGFIINSIQNGVLNLHPGLLPEVRGLDAILWSIYHNFPLGVTSHLIDDKIDAGRLVVQDKINIESIDTIESLYEKNYQLQLNLILISLNLIAENNKFNHLNMGTYNTKMSYDTQLEVLGMLSKYTKQQSTITL